MIKKVLLLIYLLSFSLFGNTQSAEGIGFVDDITINKVEFDSLDQRRIQFYPEDLSDGKVLIEGLLEPMSDAQSIKDVFVEITIDGGKTWQRALGHKDWTFSFKPTFGQVYIFSLRLVKDKPSSTEDSTLPPSVTIGDFTLVLNSNSSINDGILSGSGFIQIPLFSNLQLNNTIPVEFSNLSIEGNRITQGEITYESSVSINTYVADIDISRIVISSQINGSYIDGNIKLKGFFGSIEEIDFSNSTFNNDLFSIKTSISNKTIPIVKEKGVFVDLKSCDVLVSYEISQNQPTVSLENIQANLNFGQLIKENGSALVADFQNIGDSTAEIYNLQAINRNVNFGDTNILLNQLRANLNISDLFNPVIHIHSTVDFSRHNNLILKQLDNATLDAIISPFAINGTVSSNSNFQPISLLNRGGGKKDVRIVFDEKQTNSIAFDFSEDSPKFNINSMQARVSFGDTFQKNFNGTLEPIIGEIELSAENLNIYNLRFVNSQTGYILGKELALNSVSAQLDLNNLSLAFEGFVDTQKFDDPLLQSLSGSTFNGEISPNSFQGSISLNGGLSPIKIADRGGPGRDVVLNIQGTPTINLSFNDNIDFDFSDFQASVNFGDVLQTSMDGNSPLIAQLRKRNGIYSVQIPTNSKVYLLGKDFAIKDLIVALNYDEKSFSVRGKVNTENSSDILFKSLNDASINLTIAKGDIKAELTTEGSLDPIVVLDRGAEDKNVQLTFPKNTEVKLEIVRNEINVSLANTIPSLSFGDLFDSSNVSLRRVRGLKSVYSWSIRGRKNFIDNLGVKFANLRGQIDIRDLNNPKITFSANLDFNNLANNIQIENALISKDGFRLDVEIPVETIDIWREKNVKLVFEENPLLTIFANTSSQGAYLSNVEMSLHFGELLENTIARLRQEEGPSLENNMVYRWDINEAKKIANSEIILRNTSGILDLRNILNPYLQFDAMLNINNVSPIFENTEDIFLENALLNKNGLEANFSTQLNDIDLWEEKNIRLVFDDNASQELYLKVDKNSAKVDIVNLNAHLDFGTLINARADISFQRPGFYPWRLNGRHLIEGTDIYLEDLVGSFNLPNLKVNFNSKIDLSGFGDIFANLGDIRFNNAKISSLGFEGDILAKLPDIDIWKEKRVKIKFPNLNTPSFNKPNANRVISTPDLNIQTFKFKMTRDDFDIALGNINANIDFGELLDGAIVPLIPNKCFYSWSLQNSYNLINDENGNVDVSQVEGTLNLCDLSDPFILLDASADFSNYNYNDINLNQVNLDDTKISKNGIDWNLNIQDASAEVTILVLGAKEDNVRAEFFNINAQANNQGGQVDSADGKLYFGALFDKREPIDLHLRRDENSNLKTYTFEDPETYTYTKGSESISFKNISGTVVEVSRGVYKVILNGKSELRTNLLSEFGLNGVDFNNLQIDSRGLSGNIQANLRNHIHSILNGNVSFQISRVSLDIDTSLNTPFTLNGIDGFIDLSNIFDEFNAKARLSFVNNRLSWSMDDDLHLYDFFIFKNLSGEIDIGNIHALDSISFNGDFSYEGFDDLDLSLSGFSISEHGLDGTVRLNRRINNIFDFDNLSLKSLAINFGQNISGGIGLSYKNTSFLSSGKSLDLDFDADINMQGISDFTLRSNGNYPSLDIPNFAKLSFNNIEINPDFDDFSFTLDGFIKPDNEDFTSDDNIELRGINISKTGISVEGGRIPINVSGSDADLGGFPLSLDELAIGFQSDKLYLDAKGELSLEIASARAGLKLYSDGSINVDDIGITINTSVFSAGGNVSWYSNHHIYGNGYGAELFVRIIDSISSNAEFRIGSFNNRTYWMAGLGSSLPSPIPIGPLAMYTLGGGVAYNMKYENDKFVPKPSGGTNMMFKLNSLLGTLDRGFSWHGKLNLDIDTDGQILVKGDSYILSTLHSNPSDKHIGVDAALAFSPFSFHLKGNSSIKYPKNVLEVTGDIDILFSDSEKHIYIGTKQGIPGFNVASETEPITVDIIKLFKARGYFMINTRQLAFGVNYRIKDKWTVDLGICDAYAGFEAGANTDVVMIYNPFNLYAEIGAYLGVYAGACRVDGFDIGVNMLLKLSTPNPNFLWGRFQIDFPIWGKETFSGHIYGKGSSEDSVRNIPIVTISEPFEGNNSTSILPSLTIVPYTNFRDITLGKVELINMDTGGNRIIPLREVSFSHKEITYIPERPLDSNTRYKLKANASYYVDDKRVRGEYFREFRTQNDSSLRFNEIVKEIKPRNNSKIREEDKIEIHYTDKFSSLSSRNRNRLFMNLIDNYEFSIKNAKRERIEGSFEFISSQDGSIKSSNFIPSEPMRIFHFCKNSRGEIKETYKVNGRYLNPFRGYTVDPIDMRGVAGNLELRDEVRNGVLGSNSGEDSNENRNVNIYSNSGGLIGRISGEILNNVRLDYLDEEASNDEYTYYISDTYTINAVNTSDDSVVYTSEFKIISNEITAENARRFEDLHHLLKPELTYRPTVILQGIQPRLDANNCILDPVNFVYNPGYEQIGIDMESFDIPIEVVLNLRMQRNSDSVENDGEVDIDSINTGIEYDKEYRFRKFTTNSVAAGVTEDFAGDGEKLCGINSGYLIYTYNGETYEKPIVKFIKGDPKEGEDPAGSRNIRIGAGAEQRVRIGEERMNSMNNMRNNLRRTDQQTSSSFGFREAIGANRGAAR